MGVLSLHHKELTDGVGKCSVPMWVGNAPYGFCDELAYGEQEKAQKRYGYEQGGKWYQSYAPRLACYKHGGPKKDLDKEGL